MKITENIEHAKRLLVSCAIDVEDGDVDFAKRNIDEAITLLLSIQKEVHLLRVCPKCSLVSKCTTCPKCVLRTEE